MGAFKNMVIGIEQIVDAKTETYDNHSVAMGLFAAHAILMEVNGGKAMDHVVHDALIYAAEHAAGLGSAAQVS